jgi:hypothetical protein
MFAVDDDPRQRPAKSSLEADAELSHAGGTRVGLLLPQLESFAETDGEGDALGAAADTHLLGTAEQQRLNLHSVADEQGADPRWAVELVSGCRHGGDAKLAKVDGKFADDLDRVGVQRRPGIPAQASGLLHWLQDAGLVVAEHQGDQARRLGE